MTPPANQSFTKLLAPYGINPAKIHGQHFLQDQRHLDKLINIKELNNIHTILEIGPGPGNLTEKLLTFAPKLIAVEIDHRFARLLQDRFAACGNFNLIMEDVLHSGNISDKVTAALRETWEKGWAVVSNLPYQIASTVIIEAIHLPVRPKVMTLTIQKEVSCLLQATNSTKAYSALSVITQSYTNVQKLAIIPPGAFWPRPKVDSAIVKLTTRPNPGIINPTHFRSLVNRMFAHRRKMLRAKFLKDMNDTEKQLTKQAFRELGIPENARAEQLPVQTFINLSNHLATANKNSS